MDGKPLFTLGPEGSAAFLTDAVILSSPPGFGFAPLGFDEFLLLHPMQDGVEHALRPLDAPVGEFAHPLDEGVAVILALGQH